MAINRNILEYHSVDLDRRQAKKDMWRRATIELNMAGPKKDTSQWKKVWTDLRLGMRKKWEKAQQSQYILTEYEKRVISACGMIDKSPDEDEEPYENSGEVSSFLAFLQNNQNKEHETILDYSDYLREGSTNSNFHYLNESNEFIICQPPEINVKDEFDEEPTSILAYQESTVECISDDEPIKCEDIREPSVEYISDDEECLIIKDIKHESSPQRLRYDEAIVTETCPRLKPIELDVEPQSSQPIEIKCSEIPKKLSSALPREFNKKIGTRKKNSKYATLKEIRKMHRNLLKESKKQTALLKKLVQRMQH